MADLDKTQHFSALAYGVLAPLRTAGLNKSETQFLSRQRNLPTADQPVMPLQH